MERSREGFSTDYLKSYLEATFDAQEFDHHYPSERDLQKDEVEQYLRDLNRVPEMASCDDVTVHIRTTREENETGVECTYSIQNGVGRVLGDQPDASDLIIELPEEVLAYLIRHEVSWDEAHIGYWCRFYPPSEEVGEFHFWEFMTLWRLLQAPYYGRSAGLDDIRDRPDKGRITRDSVIASVLEKYGDPITRILRRYGLYCWGCHHAGQETIQQGARAHGLSDETVDRMIAEMNRLVSSSRQVLEPSLN